MSWTRRKFIISTLGAAASLGAMGAFDAPGTLAVKPLRPPGKPPPKTTTTQAATTTNPATTVPNSTTIPATTTTVPSNTTSTVPNSRTPEQYGAVGNGIADDTVAVQAALNAGGTIRLTGIYRHTAVLVASVNGTTILGPGTLKATNPGQSALKITGANVTVDGLNLWMQVASPRLSSDQSAKLWLSNCTGAIIRNVHIDGSGSAGIFIKGASNYLLEDCTVANTLADGIHNTGGSHDGEITRCSCSNVGDDGFAVVSYVPDGAQCYNITFNSPRFYGQPWGRGFSVVGGHDVTFNDIYGENSAGAMLYFAAEAEWNTYAAQRVTVNGGTIVRANQNSTIDHGAVMIYVSQAGLINADITIVDLHITDTRSSASRQVSIIGPANSTLRTTLANFTIVGGPSTLLYAQSPYNSSGWTFNGAPVAAHTGW